MYIPFDTTTLHKNWTLGALGFIRELLGLSIPGDC